jgi:hypothetical protein
MRSRLILFEYAFIGLVSILSGCLPQADPAGEIRTAVAGTLTAWPAPTPSLTPSPAPAALTGLFCEYRFCLGHPADVAFFDVNAGRNPASPSSYSQGILATYTANLFIEVIWQTTTPNSDAQAMLDLVLEDGVDTRQGSLDIKLVGDLDVLYSAINTTATPLLPYGSAAAWNCGDRTFAWKAYTTQESQSEALLNEALRSFRCE